MIFFLERVDDRRDATHVRHYHGLYGFWLSLEEIDFLYYMSVFHMPKGITKAISSINLCFL